MKFIKKNWLLLLILVVGAFLRFYKIGEYMTFLGDEGRDAIVVRNLLVKLDPILIGPGTSIGSMYLGPLYYYFMAPFLLLFNFSPIGPAVGVALMGVATIYLVYITGRDWFPSTSSGPSFVGLVAAGLYAISPTVIIYSRSSWNPNIMPFFALLSVYSIWKVYEEKKYKWLMVSAISLAFVLQSHYLGILLAPVLFIFWLLGKPKHYIRYTIYSALIFLFLMSPLALFDFRHDYLNSKAFFKFITVRQETVSIRPWTAIPKSYPIFEQINSSLLTAKQEPAGQIVSLFMIFFLVIIFLRDRKLFTNHFSLITLWLVTATIGFGIYKQHIYDHYFGFVFAVPFLLTAVFVQKIYVSKYKIIGLSIVLILVCINLFNNTPFKISPCPPRSKW